MDAPDGWTLEDEDKALVRSFKFKDFSEAFGFLTRLALHAEKVDHHPEFTSVWNRVDFRLTTHSAGAGMTYRAMESNAQGLAERGIATLRYQFPYMEKGSRRPDPPKIAHAAVRAAAAKAVEVAPDLPLFAGGRSFGGRMTSQAQAIEPLPAVRGLAFLGFPLHPAGKPGIERADHLAAVRI